MQYIFLCILWNSVFQVKDLTGALLSFILVTQMYETYQSGFFFLHTEFYSKFDEPIMRHRHTCVKCLIWFNVHWSCEAFLRGHVHVRPFVLISKPAVLSIVEQRRPWSCRQILLLCDLWLSSPCHSFNQSPCCFVTTSSVLCCCFKAMLPLTTLCLHSTGPYWHKMEESKKMNLTIRLNIYMEKATGVVYQALKLHWKIKLTILLLWALVKKSSRLSGIKNLAITQRKNCKVTFVHIKTVLT